MPNQRTPKPRMILDDVLKEMRKHGMSMSKTTLVEGIRQGVFPFAHNLDGTCVIMRKDFEDWAADYLIPYVEVKCAGIQNVKEHEK